MSGGWTPRHLVLAVQFLTRLPTPTVRDVRSEDLPRSIVWFPAVGLLVGAVVAGAAAAGAVVDPWLGALAGLAAWVAVTGGLHLDGLADLADALGASHRDPERFLAVLRDPHVGSFGVIALVLQLVAKLVLLHLVVAHGAAWPVALAPACARVGPLVWTRFLRPLGGGLGARFARTVARRDLAVWGAGLAAASLTSPALLAAPVLIGLWWGFLRRRVGGVTGDCHGAGIELVETGLLLALALALAR